MIARSSLRPVWGVIDWLRSISASRLMPSGVTSKAQAKNNAMGRPARPAIKNTWMIQFGASIRSRAKSATWITTQPSST